MLADARIDACEACEERRKHNLAFFIAAAVTPLLHFSVPSAIYVLRFLGQFTPTRNLKILMSRDRYI